MHFIFSKTTRRLVSLFNKVSADGEKKKPSKRMPDAVLTHTICLEKTLPVLDFNEDGDIEVQDRLQYEQQQGAARKPVARIIDNHTPGFLIHDKGYVRRGAVIPSRSKRSLGELDVIADEKHSKIRRLLKASKRFFFSQIGVGCLVVIYVILGGLMFDAIESSNERAVKERRKGNLEQLTRHLQAQAEELFRQHLNQTFELKYKNWRDYQLRLNPHDIEWGIKLDEHKWKETVRNAIARYEHNEANAGFKDTKDQEEKQAEIWTVTSAMLYSATVITTVGYGNITPKTTQGKILTMVYALFGIPLMFICLTNTGDLLANVFINVYSKAVNSFCFTCCNERLRKIAGYGSSDFSEIGDEMGQKKTSCQHYKQEKKHVPIVATLGALAIYILGGAGLFGVWEEWQVIDGAYFCFITFTTIGFGDFVPGQGLISPNKSWKMVLCSIFLLVGMIVMAMCFKLMQDELIAKIKTIGRKLGFIDVREQGSNGRF